jgi:CheY-like chemotaxis protein
VDTEAVPRILIVDDSEFSRLGLKRSLEPLGYEVSEASSGDIALAQIAWAEPDCLLLDLLMPGTNGFEVLERLRAARITVPVIVVTADIQKTTEARCRELGAVAVLKKPCNSATLSAALSAVLKAPRHA